MLDAPFDQAAGDAARQVDRPTLAAGLRAQAVLPPLFDRASKDLSLAQKIKRQLGGWFCAPLEATLAVRVGVALELLKIRCANR